MVRRSGYRIFRRTRLSIASGIVAATAVTGQGIDSIVSARHILPSDGAGDQQTTEQRPRHAGRDVDLWLPGSATRLQRTSRRDSPKSANGEQDEDMHDVPSALARR